MSRSILPALVTCLLLFLPLAVQKPQDKAPVPPEATPVAKLKVAKDFKVELLYSVPKDKEGSWVSMCVDPRGRLIVCDQYGGLYRVTPPAIGGKADDLKLEKIPIEIGDAHGLLWAFDSLYVMVNSNNPKYTNGLHRVRDTDNDDVLDDVKLLHKLQGGQREHGPHAILLSPDGKSLTIVCGNQEPLTKFDKTRVPPIWGEDHLLPRMPDGRGFMAGVLGPGGAMYRTDPDGKSWELLSVGYRNQYDAAYNKDGELFTYDADMEWDFNTPWYRPTRVCMAASGSEFGWRNGTGKWPAYYPDSHPAVVDIGPGSPTGVTFGYGAKFPVKYHDAFFICDWSYGKLYAVHLTPDGMLYKGEFEEFISGTPLPLTDIVINPKDGAMYFAIGGRRTQSGLYRVTYTGKESTGPHVHFVPKRLVVQRETRNKLEAFHGVKDQKAIEAAWPHLGSPDRYLRSAVRIALEHQDPKDWWDLALEEKDPQASLTVLLALVRVSASDPFHRKKDAPMPDPKLQGKILDALQRLSWDEKLKAEQLLELLRIYQVRFNRLGKPDDAGRKKVLAHLDAHFPAKDRFVNGELCQVLVYLEAPKVAERAMKLVELAATQEEQIDYIKSLRMLKTGWTPELRKEYFKWFVDAGRFKGGNSFEFFLVNIKKDAVETLTVDEKTALKSIIEAKPVTTTTPIKPRPFVKKWTVEEVTTLAEKGMKKRDYDKGRALFGATSCFSCHRINNEGGSQGPDLTGIAGRFSVRDLVETIIDPSKEISDQYASVIIETTDGKTVTGRIVNLNGNDVMINTNMLEPNTITKLDRKKIETMTTSKVSPMPSGLLETLKEDELLDLMAFLLSRGNRNHEMFRDK